MNDFIQIFLISVVLALDSFSVSIALGIKSRTHTIREATLISFFFGAFQGAMPILGWILGNFLKNSFQSLSAPIAFILLSAIGSKMIYEGVRGDKNIEKKITIGILIVLSIATSIDALIVGTTLSLSSFPFVLSVVLIGLTTFIMCIIGYFAGNQLGIFMREKIEIVGGVALILLGLKFLIF